MAGAHVKLDDGNSNTLTFYVNSYDEQDVDYDVYQRTTDKTMKSYNIARKKRFSLGLKNMNNSDKDTLKTIYDLRTALDFYQKATDGSRTAQVIWKGNFNLHTPTNKSKQFLNLIYEGSIILEEV